MHTGHSSSITGNDSILGAVEQGGELVCCGLRTNSLTREITLQAIANERSLTDGVLTDQEHHGLRRELAVLHEGSIETLVHVLLFNGAKLGLVPRI